MIYKHGEWAFVHVPKNAGTTFDAGRAAAGLGNFLPPGVEPRVGEPHPFHHNKWSWWRQFPEMGALKPIAICRNPWSRCLSLYLFNVANCSNNLHEEWGRVGHVRLVREGFKGAWMPGGMFAETPPEAEWDDESDGRRWGQSDQQHTWMPEDGRWFRMEDELDEFSEFTGVPMKKRKNVTKHVGYREYYDMELRVAVRRRYRDDVEKFGYAF